MAAASLIFRIFADTKELKGGVDTARRELDRLHDSASNVGNRMLNVLPPTMVRSARDIGSAVGMLAGAFGGLGGVVAGLGVGAIANDFLNTTGSLSDLSAQTDITVRDLQRFQYAGDLVGVSLDSIVGAVGQLQNRLGSGDKGAFKALDDLGLTFRDLQRLDPGQQFEAIASAISRVQDPTQRAAIAMDLFGRAGVSMLPLLRSDMASVGDAAFVLSDEVVSAGDSFGDLLTKATNFGKAAIGTVVLGPIVRWAEALQRELASVGAMFDYVRGKAEKLQDVKPPAGFGAVRGAPDITMEFQEAMRLSDQLNTQLERAQAKRVSAARDAAQELQAAANDVIRRVEAQAEAHHQLQLWIGRNTMALREMVVETRSLSVLTPLLVEDFSSLAEKLETQVPTLERMNDALAQSQREIHGVIEQAKASMAADLSVGLDFGKQLSGAIMGAIQGGGGIGRSIGAFLGDQIGSTLGASLAKALGSKLGGALGGMLGPLGAIGGQLLGGVIDKIFSSKGRDAVESFAAGMGGFDALRTKLNDLGAEGERLWLNLTQRVGKGNVEQAQSAIAAIETALDAHKAKATDTAAAITEAQNDATSGLRTRIGELGSEYDRLWNTIRDEAPEEVMGIVERQTRERMASIERERGGLQAQLEAMTESLAESFGNIGIVARDAAREIVDAFTGLRIPPIRVPIEVPGMEVPEMAAGGIVRSPTLALVGEAGPEAVVPLGQMAGLGSAGMKPLLNEIVGLRTDMRRQTDLTFRAIRDALQTA